MVYVFRPAGPFVGGSFASCISQYVLVVADSDFAEKVVAVVLPVNAAVVVALQYAVGRRLSARNIRPLMTLVRSVSSSVWGIYCFRQQPAAMGALCRRVYAWRGHLRAR